MKKLLGILVLGLLLGALASCDDGCPKGKKRKGGVCSTDWSMYDYRPWYEKIFGVFDRSYEKEMCEQRAKSASNSFSAKKIYKACMKE
jgi:hypothetical protein